jgi:hypothetical protein
MFMQQNRTIRSTISNQSQTQYERKFNRQFIGQKENESFNGQIKNFNVKLGWNVIL